MMRIGFTGSQGTGKTSLAKAMVASPEFGDYYFVPSASRDSLAAGFKINQDASRLDQLVTTLARVVKEREAFELHDKVIGDRMVLDSLAYTKYQMESVWVPDQTDEYYMDVSRRLALSSAKDYDQIYFFPPYWAPKDDGGVRSVDRNYQYAISDTIEEYLWGIPHMVMPDMPVCDRLEWIKSKAYTPNNMV